ncbi:poly [ADP-ribose] polymerase 14-like isoform X2 [Acanthaster planci]|uniref:Poly [ADP-ribose] polymerase n=1 Tax=Acanthaster planci TaxID=133434 RepID=A0A8B7YVN1_ACAPL|nr:poly [ADP-ribose] polymerase 14-like isoform X2 [Acanthaster planci]
MASSDQSQQTSIHVLAPPIRSLKQQSKFLNKLYLYFQKTSASSNDIKNVSMLSSDEEALRVKVNFTKPSDVKHILSRTHHKLVCNGKTIPLHVEPFRPTKTPVSTAPPVKSDSVVKVQSLDSLKIHDSDSDASKGSTGHTNGQSLAAGCGENPLSKPTSRMTQVSCNEGVLQTSGLYTPVCFEKIATPACLALSDTSPSASSVTTPSPVTQLTVHTSTVSQLTSPLPAVPPDISPAGPPSATVAPPTTVNVTAPSSTPPLAMRTPITSQVTSTLPAVSSNAYPAAPPATVAPPNTVSIIAPQSTTSVKECAPIISQVTPPVSSALPSPTFIAPQTMSSELASPSNRTGPLTASAPMAQLASQSTTMPGNPSPVQEVPSSTAVHSTGASPIAPHSTTPFPMHTSIVSQLTSFLPAAPPDASPTLSPSTPAAPPSFVSVIAPPCFAPVTTVPSNSSVVLHPSSPIAPPTVASLIAPAPTSPLTVSAPMMLEPALPLLTTPQNPPPAVHSPMPIAPPFTASRIPPFIPPLEVSARMASEPVSPSTSLPLHESPAVSSPTPVAPPHVPALVNSPNVDPTMHPSSIDGTTTVAGSSVQDFQTEMLDMLTSVLQNTPSRDVCVESSDMAANLENRISTQSVPYNRGGWSMGHFGYPPPYQHPSEMTYTVNITKEVARVETGIWGNPYSPPVSYIPPGSPFPGLGLEAAVGSFIDPHQFYQDGMQPFNETGQPLGAPAHHFGYRMPAWDPHTPALMPANENFPEHAPQMVSTDGFRDFTTHATPAYENNTVLQAEGEKQQDDHAELEEEEVEKLVEVTDFKPTTSEEMLRLYFENPRKSRGGDIEAWEKDIKSGAIRIKYSDPSVAKAVTERAHKVERCNLSVRLIVKKKPRPRPVKKRCLFLSGIPDECSLEHLSLYLENCSGMDEPRIQYGEMPGTALCTFPQDIPDFQKVIKKISSKKLQKAQVTAEVVLESDCILVQGLTKEVSLELIELYFDNKKSGGGGVKKVLQVNAKDKAIVYFEDWNVVGEVLSRKEPHKVSNTLLTVEEYHDCLGRLTSLDAPTPHIPKPISVMVPINIMEFIYRKGQETKKKLVEELRKVNASLTWPDGDKKMAARLEPLVGDGQPPSVWINWSQLCREALASFLDGCMSKTVPVPTLLWKEATAKLAKISTSQTCSVVLDSPTHSVRLVGEKRGVDEVVTDIKQVIKELQAKAYRDAQQTKQEIGLTVHKVKLLVQCGVRQRMEQRFPDLKITVKSTQGKEAITLEGKNKNVKEANLLMQKWMNELSSVEFKTGKTKTEFVRNVNDKVHEIWRKQRISAACDISEDKKITVYGATREDTHQAKKFIEDRIQDDTISINGRAVAVALKCQSGLQLIDGINQKKLAVVNVNYESGCLELAGFRNELKETKQCILSFFKDTVRMKDAIRTSRSKVRLIDSFHRHEVTNFTAKRRKDDVIIRPQMSGPSKGFLLESNETGLDAARKFITQLLAKIKEKRYPVSKIGMAQLFRETKGKNFLKSVEKKLKCVIDIVGDEEDDIEEGSNASQSPGTTEVLCKITLPDGCTLRVCKGDLTKQIVDCIVNAANEDLKHIGGLAGAILQAGGKIIQTESNQILKHKGRRLSVGEPVCTSSGKLPCKKVIHVAGPRWSQWPKRNTPEPRNEPTNEESLLFRGVLACLKLADELGFQSIAIPAISTGVFGFPVHLAAVQIVDAVAEFCQKKPNTSLTEISLTNHDQPTCNAMRRVVMDKCGHLFKTEPTPDNVTGARDASTSTDETAAGTMLFTSTGPNILKTREGVTVTMKKGSITEEQADVIVNSSANSLNLDAGLVSRAILEAAGPDLQRECNEVIAARGNISAGSFVETGSAALSYCKKIFHCVLDGYHSNTSGKSLATLVQSLLKQAETLKMVSMAIPALGTGNLNYPPDVTARVMYEAVVTFSSQHPNAVLKDIRFVVYDKDTKTIKGFEDEIERLTSGAVRGAAAPAFTQRRLKKAVSTSALEKRNSLSPMIRDSTGVLHSKIGPVCLQVCQGDLVNETSQAIVNSVGQKLGLQGPVSTALLAAGGDKIREECDAHRAKDPTKKLHVTSAGELPCDLIFHVVTPTTPAEVKDAVAKTLHEAEERKVKSISFPALGTGYQLGQAVASLASAMLAAIGEFACREPKPRHLQLIRLVIFKPEMFPQCEDALKQGGRSYTDKTSLLSKGTDMTKSLMPGAATDETSTDKAPDETILLQIFALDQATIQKATDKIDKFQSEEFTSEDVPDKLGMITKMTEEEQAELKIIERKYKVHIELLKQQAKCIRVKGLKINVKDARYDIQELFTRMQVQETEKQRSKHLTKEVQWKYYTPTGVEDYDADINTIIEDAYQKKQALVTIDLVDGQITIDFSKMQELSKDGALTVSRVDLLQAAKFETPSTWIPMKKKEHFRLVPLAIGTKEYTDVETGFQLSMGRQAVQITQILRIQNRELLMQYQARRTALEARLGRTNIEETLYHGTDEQTCDKINKFGFNRSFCGKNATMYGNGTYFAVEASYSASSSYARPNASNIKHIYATKVLVGDFTTGCHGMLVPPNKPNNPDQLFDSVVNNTNSPRIYVIFHDAQAYPEHLIKFR